MKIFAPTLSKIIFSFFLVLPFQLIQIAIGMYCGFGGSGLFCNLFLLPIYYVVLAPLLLISPIIEIFNNAGNFYFITIAIPWIVQSIWSYIVVCIVYKLISTIFKKTS